MVGDIQIACREGRVFAAPIKASVITNSVSVTDSMTVCAVSNVLRTAVEAIPSASLHGTEPDLYSPFQVIAGVKRVTEWERGLRTFSLSVKDGGYVLTRFVPYTGGKRGFVGDPNWTKMFSPDEPYEAIAEVVIHACNDPSWKTR